MSESPYPDDQIWNRAETLIERVEQASRSAALSAEAFFADAADGLRLTAGASACSFWVREGETQTRLAGSGISLAVEPSSELLDAVRDHAAVSRWLSTQPQSPDRLVTVQSVAEGVHLGIDLRFDQAVDFRTQAHLSDLTEVIADVACKVYLRTQLAGLRRRLDQRGDRDRVIGNLHQGTGLSDSFAAIACTLAAETSVDRVSLLQKVGNRWRLVTASTQATIDRGARQVRMIEAMTAAVAKHHQRYWFVVGDGDPMDDRGPEVDNFLQESGCREICVEVVEVAADEPKAAIVLERYRQADPQSGSIQEVLAPWRIPVASAISEALNREDASWAVVVSRLGSYRSRRTIGYGLAAACLLGLIACFVPTTLRIPCEGRVVASDRAGMFAPAEGVVDEVLVSNGQSVHEGQMLVVLRSPELQLQQQNIEAALAAARARLAALLAMRTRGGSGVDRSNQSSVAADEKVARTEISGLQKQLELLRQQQAALIIRSPMDGRVDRWDLRQSLEARPVTHGQHLLDVVSDDGAWNVELDFPERNVHYLLDAMRSEPCLATLRLRSNPTETSEGKIDRVAKVAHLTPTGQSVIRVTVPVDSGDDERFRGGATVLAQIHCGKRPIGFVWFRGLIEWSRSQTWL